MKNSTVQSPKQRPTQPGAKPGTAQQRRRKPAPRAPTLRVKQTARLEGRRDGTPLLFGWGRHLTRAQKARIQRNAAYGFFGAVTIAVLGTFLFGVLQQIVFIPNATFLRVNGTSVSQDTYRKTLAFNAQDQWNTMQADIKKHDDLLARAQKGDSSVKDQLAAIISVVETEESNYSQASITQTTADQLTEDQLIQQAIPSFAKHDPSATQKLTPTADVINSKFNAFKAATGSSYQNFVSQNGLSDDDVKTAIALHLRRDLMQTYLATQFTSPTLQMHLRHIEVNSQADAQKVLSELQKDKLTSPDANWTAIAKKESVDPNTKDIGGDMGWVVRGTNDAAIEVWAFDTLRHKGDLSGVIATAGGTFDVVQALDSATRDVDSATLQNIKTNALSHWLGGERAVNQVTKPDADMLQSARNMPKTPDLNAPLPNYNPGTGPGSPPGSFPGAPPQQ
jgi:parvulin-like peptidyl-prolyl isomerase